MEFINTYILTWKLPIALAIASLSILSIRNAYRKVRIGDLDILDHGAVEQAFMASLWVCIAALVYVYTFVLILGVWICFIHRHLMTHKAWMASWLAIAIGVFWYFVLYYALPRLLA